MIPSTTTHRRAQLGLSISGPFNHNRRRPLFPLRDVARLFTLTALLAVLTALLS